MRIAIHHIGILTTDIDESMRFYTNNLGMQVRSQITSYGRSEIVLGDGSKTSKILLYLIGPPFSSWMEAFITRHGPMLAFLGLEVDAIDVWNDYLQTKKIDDITPVEEIDGAKQFFLSDPAGIMIKLLSYDTPFPTTSVGSGESTEAASKYRLSHTNITCHEINSLKDFYVNMLGMRVVFDRRDEGMIFLADPEALADDAHDIFPLELFGPPGLWEPDQAFLEKHGAGLQYLCFAVDDVDKAYQDLLAKGVDFHLQPTDFGENRVAFFKDPNGIDIEILHPLSQTILRGSVNA